MSDKTCVIIGSGVFGTTCAIELAKRKLFTQIHVLEQGDVPNPLCSSYDISRLVRADYGSDALYTSLALEAIEKWKMLNEKHQMEIYRETGILNFQVEDSELGKIHGYTLESYTELTKRGFKLLKLNDEIIRTYFPEWKVPEGTNGYYNPIGGWVDNGLALRVFIEEAKELGVQFHPRAHVRSFVKATNEINETIFSGVLYKQEGASKQIDASLVVAATGAWTNDLLPELSHMFTPSAQPLFYMEPGENLKHRFDNSYVKYVAPHVAKRLNPERVPVHTSFPGCVSSPCMFFYLFPCSNGIMKIGHHGSGIRGDQYSMFTSLSGQREDLPEELLVGFKEFVRKFLPTLHADYKMARTRTCFYTDTIDSNFYVDFHPKVSNLFLAVGGSGHAFKFMPALGGVIADGIERISTEYTERFAFKRAIDSGSGDQARAKSAS